VNSTIRVKKDGCVVFLAHPVQYTVTKILAILATGSQQGG